MCHRGKNHREVISDANQAHLKHLRIQSASPFQISYDLSTYYLDIITLSPTRLQHTYGLPVTMVISTITTPQLMGSCVDRPPWVACKSTKCAIHKTISALIFHDFLNLEVLRPASMLAFDHRQCIQNH